MQRNNIKEYFDRVSEDYLAAYQSQGSLRSFIFLARREKVLEMLNGSSGRALDIGCGPGIFTFGLLNKGYQEIHGIDVSVAMIEQAKRLSLPAAEISKVHFSAGEIENLKFQDDYFDAVICIGVLEYLDDDSMAMSEVRRVLKIGGEAVFSVPNIASPLFLIDKSIVVMLNILFKALALAGIRIKLSSDSLLFSAAIKDKYYFPAKLNKKLRSFGFRIDRKVCHIYRLTSLNAISPKLAIWLARKLEWLSDTALSWLGINYMVKVRKV